MPHAVLRELRVIELHALVLTVAVGAHSLTAFRDVTSRLHAMGRP